MHSVWFHLLFVHISVQKSEDIYIMLCKKKNIYKAITRKRDYASLANSSTNVFKLFAGSQRTEGKSSNCGTETRPGVFQTHNLILTCRYFLYAVLTGPWRALFVRLVVWDPFARNAVILRILNCVCEARAKFMSTDTTVNIRAWFPLELRNLLHCWTRKSPSDM